MSANFQENMLVPYDFSCSFLMFFPHDCLFLRFKVAFRCSITSDNISDLGNIALRQLLSLDALSRQKG